MEPKNSKTKSFFVDSTFENLESPYEIFSITKLCGSGTYGAVYKAVHKKTEAEVAIKLMIFGKKNIKEIRTEMEILRKYSSHVNIARFYGAFLEKMNPTSKSPQLWVVMEFCGGGSVFDIVRAYNFALKTVSESWCIYFLVGILRALDFLHDKGIVHRDVKAQNIMINNEGIIKLVDFGVSCILTHEKPFAKEFIGTPFWMAPEVCMCQINKNAVYDYRSDIWSVGITAIEIVEGLPPFTELGPVEALKSIPLLDPPKLKNRLSRSRAYNNFIKKCLIKDFTKRPEAEHLLKDPLFSSLKNSEPDIIREFLVKKFKIKKTKMEIIESMMNSYKKSTQVADIIFEECGLKTNSASPSISSVSEEEDKTVPENKEEIQKSHHNDKASPKEPVDNSDAKITNVKESSSDSEDNDETTSSESLTLDSFSSISSLAVNSNLKKTSTKIQPASQEMDKFDSSNQVKRSFSNHLHKLIEFILKTEEILCGDLYDNSVLLLGTSNGLLCINLPIGNQESKIAINVKFNKVKSNSTTKLIIFIIGDNKSLCAFTIPETMGSNLDKICTINFLNNLIPIECNDCQEISDSLIINDTIFFSASTKSHLYLFGLVGIERKFKHFNKFKLSTEKLINTFLFNNGSNGLLVFFVYTKEIFKINNAEQSSPTMARSDTHFSILRGIQYNNNIYFQGEKNIMLVRLENANNNLILKKFETYDSKIIAIIGISHVLLYENEKLIIRKTFENSKEESVKYISLLTDIEKCIFIGKVNKNTYLFGPKAFYEISPNDKN